MKLAVAGIGTIAREVLPLAAEWGWEISALCATPRSREALRSLAETCRAAAYEDYPSMLEEAEADAVYIAVPNHLHFAFASQALARGRNVILEKPMASNPAEARRLAELARERDLFLFEAVSTLYLPGYERTRQWLPRIGPVKLASCNFSQYSRRYEAFRAGTVLPVFDPARCGGALMDLGVYNFHYLIGLLGAPERAAYHANVERGIDTSGVAVLTYGGFQAVSAAAKDCAAPSGCLIQGERGFIRTEGAANCGGRVCLRLRDGTEETCPPPPASRLEPEFRFFAREIASGSREACRALLDHSLRVSEALTQARLSAGVRFPGD